MWLLVHIESTRVNSSNVHTHVNVAESLVQRKWPNRCIGKIAATHLHFVDADVAQRPIDWPTVGRRHDLPQLPVNANAVVAVGTLCVVARPVVLNRSRARVGADLA